MNRLKTISTLLFLVLTFGVKAQLSGHLSDDATYVGYHFGFTTINHPTSTFEVGEKHGAYFGLGMDVGHTDYTPGALRYHLEMKWTLDIFNKGMEFFDETALDARIDLTGFTWHKIGINVFASDNFCFGLGGSFADYIVDVPLFADEEGNFFEGIRWQEPSGWNWTAGPCIFLDYGIGDFVLNFIGSYDFTYYTPKITDDYEALTQKIDGYKNPSFVYFDFVINHDSGVYLSYNSTQMQDNGTLGNDVSRSEVKLGWKWWL